MGTTSNRALRYPSGSSTIQVPADIKALADDVDAQLGPDTGWLDLVSLVTGWTIPGGHVAQVRRIGSTVLGRGYLQNASFTGGFTTVATFPAGIPAPPYLAMFPADANTSANRAWQVTTASPPLLQVYAAGASAAFYPLWALRYSIT